MAASSDGRWGILGKGFSVNPRLMLDAANVLSDS